jgi:transcriptional regulator with GAF, ATPase, and Fis domain
MLLNDGHLRLLQSYSWPGNIRELENVIERALITSQAGTLRIILPDSTEKGMLPPHPMDTVLGDNENTVLTQDAMRQFEIQNVISALEQTDWKIYGRGGAAELLGVKPSTLSTRIKAWGITRPQ